MKSLLKLELIQCSVVLMIAYHQLKTFFAVICVYFLIFLYVRYGKVFARSWLGLVFKGPRKN